ncbi:MAG TPA: HD domain-containing phosphohydrolase [Fimbriimonadaceae bacterium]|nr:HD domain-containing phosphohydrolase [Fimbriimonadaceae bacterium]
MDIEVIGVVAVALAASLCLLYYVSIWLPRQFNRRILESLEAFSKAIELRFPSHRGTTELAMDRAAELGHRLGFGASRIAELEMATRLRDIGLVAVPYRLVNHADMNEWTVEEQLVYDKHPEVGAAMIEQVPSLRHLGCVVRYHHVRWDRTRDREDIPMESRILKVVTDYGWLEREVGPDHAKAILTRLAGHDYHPDVVRHLLTMLNSESESGFARAVVRA